MSGAGDSIRLALAALCTSLAGVALAAQDPSGPPAGTPAGAPAVAPTPAPVEPAPASQPPVLDFNAAFDHAAYEAALGRIAEAFPDLMRVRSLGQSRGGREIWLAVLADPDAGEARKLPAAVVMTDLAAGSSAGVAGPQAALFVLENLLARARSDPALRERFARSAVYFLPAPDPDLAFAAPLPLVPTGGGTNGGTEGGTEGIEAGALPRASRLEENFPARWLPFGPSVRSPGPYALSEPESRTLARFLLERENVSTIVVLSRRAVDAEGEDGGDDASAGAPAPGSLRAFCREILDLAVLEARPWTGEVRSTPIGSAPQGFETAAALVLNALDGLPRLQCGGPKVERLRPDLWLVDLPLGNAGMLPTLGGESRRPWIPSVSMKVGGGRVVACALRESESGSYRAIQAGGERQEIVPIGHLDGLSNVGVRLVVQAEEGAELSVSFNSARAGTAGVGASLR